MSHPLALAGNIIAASQLVSKICFSCFRASDDFKRKTESLDILRQECEHLDYSSSQESLYEITLLTKTVNDFGTTLKHIRQRLKELEIDDGTTLRRSSQLKRQLYVSQGNFEGLKEDIALRVPRRQASFLAQRYLLVLDDASALLQILVEEPIGVPISDAAGSMDNRHIMYRSDKDLGAMRAPHRKLLEGRASNLSRVSFFGATGCGKSTLVRALTDEGACINNVTSTSCYSYGLDDRVFCDIGVSIMSTMDRSSLHKFYNWITKRNSASYYPSRTSSSEDVSYGSSVDLPLATTSSTPTWCGNIWYDDTLQKWSFLHSRFKRLGHAMSSISLRTSKVLTLVSPIWFTSPASAEASHCGSQNDSVRLKTGPHDYGSWFQAINHIQRDVLFVSRFYIPSFLTVRSTKKKNLIHPQNSSGLTPPPAPL